MLLTYVRDNSVMWITYTIGLPRLISINSQITGRGIQQRESNNKYNAIYYCPNILSNGHEIYFLLKKTGSLVRAIVYIYFHAVCLVI